MPRYKIGMSWGFAGDEHHEVIEADNAEEAAKEAWEIAIEQVDGYVVREIPEGENVDDWGDEIEEEEEE